MSINDITAIDRNFLENVSNVLLQARKNAKTAVNLSMVYAYYEIGRMIVEEEQRGEKRAAYGKQILQELSKYLTNKFGKGYSAENLKLASNVKKTAAKVIRGGVNYWKKTWLGKEFYKRTKSGSDWKVNLLLKLGGFEREKGKSIFHARDICIQKLGGYNNFYDFVFDSATNISKPLKYKFTDRKDYKFNMKRKYVIWAWKGDYLNLGAGCEVGFYNTYGSTKHYFFVKKIFTELEMRYNGNLINNYRPPKSKGEKVGHSWWITTFNAGMQNNVNPSKIGFRCVADLSVLKAYARKALERRLEKSKRWNVEGNKATLKWNY